MKLSTKLLENTNRNNTAFPFYIYKPERKQSNLIIPTHWHQEFEMIYTNCGGTIEINGLQHKFEGDSILFINKEELHTINTYSDGLLYAIVFDFSFLDSKYNDSCQSNIINPLKEKKVMFPTLMNNESEHYLRIKELVLSLIEFYYSDTLGKEIKIKCHLYDLLFTFYSNDLFVKARPDEQDYDRSQLAYVKATITYMEDHYTHHITIDDLAENVCLSKHHLIRLFKQITGVTPFVYLIDLRIENSITYLEKGTSITQTALLSGFNNVSYYIRVFRRKYHHSPKEYQRTLLKTT